MEKRGIERLRREGMGGEGRRENGIERDYGEREWEGIRGESRGEMRETGERGNGRD